MADKLASLPQEQQEAMHAENPAPKLADLSPREQAGEQDREQDREQVTPPKPNITTTEIGVPVELGRVTVTVAELAGTFRGGFSAHDNASGEHVVRVWEMADGFDTYEAAFDDAIANARNWAWINALLNTKPAEHNSNDVPDNMSDEEIARRGFAMRETHEELRKAQERARQLAEICAGENDPEGESNQQALAEYLGGLMDIVEQDMYNFVYGGEVE